MTKLKLIRRAFLTIFFIKFKSNVFDYISIYNHFWNLNQSFHDTPLICAAREGHIEIFDYLLSQPNIDINCRDILIQKYSFYSNLFFIQFQFLNFFGI